MPSGKKTLHFLLSAQASVAAVGILGYGMSTDWVTSSMSCTIANGTTTINGTASVKLGLFDGELSRTLCPFGGGVSLSVMEELGKVGGAPPIINGLVICTLVFCLLFSAGSILITLYNTVSNPYETYMGPLGLYACSATSACLSFAVMVLYAVNVLATTMGEQLLENNVGSVDLGDKKVDMNVGFFLIIPYLALNLLAILVVYLYEHAAYTQRREQQKPTEDAPKEIMMY